jgi:ankyrin repeat protein
MKRTIGGKPTYENFLRTRYPSQLNPPKSSNVEVTNQQVSNQQVTSTHSQNQFNSPQMMQHKSAPEKIIWMENSNNSLTMQEHKNNQRVIDHIATVPRLNNSKTQQPTTAKFTEEILSKLLLPLLLNDVEMCVRVAEVANVEALMHMKSDSGSTVLMIAAQHGCNDVITTLLGSVSDPQAVAEKVDSSGLTVLIVAIKNTKSISAILRGVPDAYHLIAISNAAALSYSVLYGDILACKAMLHSVPSLKKKMRLIEKTNYCGDTLLTLAAKLGKTEMIQLIRESIGTESPWVELLMIKNYSEDTAVTIAIENNNLEMIKVLLVNITDEQEVRLIPYMASRHQTKEKEQRLIVIAQQDEKIALKNAIVKGSIELVKVLLDSEFNLIQRQKLVTTHAQNENSPWWYAVKNMQSDVVKIFLASIYEPNQRQELLEMIDKNGKSALQIAANKGNTEMVRNLLHGAANPQAIIFQTDDVGMYAFMLAAVKNHTTLALVIFDMTSNKYELLKHCSAYQIHTIDLVEEKLSQELVNRLTQIVNDCPQEGLKNIIEDLKNLQ